MRNGSMFLVRRMAMGARVMIGRRVAIVCLVAIMTAPFGLVQPPTALGQPSCHLNGVLGVSNIRISGQLCANASLHANGDLDGARRVRCGGLAGTSYTIFPPPFYTEPDSFPGSTCYEVLARRIAGAPILELRDRHGLTLESWPDGTSPHPDIVWKLTPGNLLEIECRSGWPFDAATGIFPPTAGDSAVIVNFAAATPFVYGVTNLTIGAGGPPIRATLINTRFVGATPNDRLSQFYWIGGTTILKGRVQMEPVAGLGLAVKHLISSGPVAIGSGNYPIGIYSTGTFDFSSSNWIITGSVISLGDIEFRGHGTLFSLAHLGRRVPQFLRGWPYFCYTPFPVNPEGAADVSVMTVAPEAPVVMAAPEVPEITVTPAPPAMPMVLVNSGDPVRIVLSTTTTEKTGARQVTSLKAEDFVTVSIVDITGRRVADLIGRRSNRRGGEAEGSIEFEWDGRTAHGTLASPGHYFARSGNSPGVAVRRLMVVR